MAEVPGWSVMLTISDRRGRTPVSSSSALCLINSRVRQCRVSVGTHIGGRLDGIEDIERGQTFRGRNRTYDHKMTAKALSLGWSASVPPPQPQVNDSIDAKFRKLLVSPVY